LIESGFIMDPMDNEAPESCALRTPSKTLQWSDLQEASVVAARKTLTRFLRRQFTLRGAAVAVNGILHVRWYVRRLKLWEYARGLAVAPPEVGQRVLDFGGGGTLTPFHAAAQGAQVRVIDIDAELSAHSERIARQRGWDLQASTVDLTKVDDPFPQNWPHQFDRIYSYCVLEHIAYSGQKICLRRLAQALAPGGRMVLSFEFGSDAPGEAPWHDRAQLNAMLQILLDQGLRLCGDQEFVETPERYPLDRRHPGVAFTFGMLVLERSR
jgi:2-polyprenyl-3-methyl-5-hydroxy-6-metoxy-1,4-benzoquinol methylase